MSDHPPLWARKILEELVNEELASYGPNDVEDVFRLMTRLPAAMINEEPKLFAAVQPKLIQVSQVVRQAGGGPP